MKHKSLVLFASLFITLFVAASNDSHNCSCKKTNHTYFAARPQFDIASPEFVSLARGLSDRRECGKGIGFQAVLYGGKSRNTKDLARYFMPFCETSVNVNGTLETNGKSILPEQFNLFSVHFDTQGEMFLPAGTNIDNTFNSTVQFKPEQTVIGLGLMYEHEFCLFGRKHWINISAPIERVQNTMGFKETIERPGEFYDVQPITGEITNLNEQLHSMKAASVQDDWKFGKIDNKKRSKTRLAFINILIGEKYLETECCHFEPFIGLTIPTGNTPKAKYVFEPIVGRGGHFGLIWGGSGGALIWQSDCCDKTLSFETDIAMKYLFSRTQKRSIPLKNKPGSQYISLYKNIDQAVQAFNLSQTMPPNNSEEKLQGIFLATPGINILTRKVKVTPGFNITANFALAFYQDVCDKGFDAEVGYNFYAQQTECLKLKNKFEETAAIKNYAGSGLTNPIGNMTNNAITNEGYLAVLFGNNTLPTADETVIRNLYADGIIKKSDLDLAQATHPCTISHTLYGTLGYHWDNMCYPVMAGLGASYEFSGKSNTSLDRWLLWAKAGISF